MKLHILSDLHLEFGGLRLPEVDTDVTVLAGDIGVGLQGIEWALQAIPCHQPVIYVMGNHEFYGQRSMPELWKKAREKVAGTHINLLENEAVEIGGVRFLGSTLWTDFDLFGDREAAMKAALDMNDYWSIITNSGAGYTGNRAVMLTPQDTLAMHQEGVAWLSKELDGRNNQPTVVVTHTAPHRGSLHPKYEHHDISPAFVSDLDDLVQRTDLWIHGHTHDSFDYQAGKCRVVCNPRGYAGRELNPGFDSGLVVEV
jgi:predicted phosphodiesterase